MPASRHPAKKPEGDRRKLYFIGVLLLASTFAMYWRTLKYPYVQDDWVVISSIVRSGSFNVIRDSFVQFGALFYRPLGTTYMVIVYTLFGSNALGVHILNLLIHFGNSLLVGLILLRLTRHQIVSWSSAFLYAASAAIHLDPLMWLVGIYDLGATFFFFLTIFLFTGGRLWSSVVAFVLSLLMKDSTIVLPAVLFLILTLNEQGGKLSVGNLPKRLPHALIAVLYLIVRAGGWMKLLGAEHGPYTSGASVGQVISTLNQYVQWSMESAVPMEMNSGLEFIVLALLLFFALRYLRSMKRSYGKLLLLAGWFFVGLIPPMLIPSNVYRYYLSYSHPAFLAIFAYAGCGVFSVFKMKQKTVTAMMTAIVAIGYHSSFELLANLEEFSTKTTRMAGSNNLMLKGAFVEPIRSYLLESYKSVEPGTTFIFEEIPAGAFGGSAGVRLWYGDSTIRAFVTIKDSEHVYLSDPMVPEHAGGDSIHFNPRTTFVIVLYNKELQSFRLSDRFSTSPFSNR